jgi:hypothetical protein
LIKYATRFSVNDKHYGKIKVDRIQNFIDLIKVIETKPAFYDIIRGCELFQEIDIYQIFLQTESLAQKYEMPVLDILRVIDEEGLVKKISDEKPLEVSEEVNNEFRKHFY